MEAALSLSTLANATLLSGDLFSGDVLDDEMYQISADLYWSMDDVTQGQGPTLVGIAHGDYSDAEIEQWLEATTSIAGGDLIANEQARRKCRRVGMFAGDSVEKLNDGKSIKTTLKFVLAGGQNLKFWAYNKSGDAYSTTSPVVRVNGKIYMRRI